MKLLTQMRRQGVRRIGFAGFCLAMVVAGLVYLSGAEHSTDRGFGAALPPVLILFGLLGLVSPMLVGRSALAPLTGDRALGFPAGGRRRFLLMAVASMVVAGAVWQQRLDDSLWTDEVTSMRENIVGRWKHRGDNEGYLLRPNWADTLLEYHTPNNHSLYSGTARLLHELFGGVNDTDFSRPYFNEVVLRLPAFIAGLLSIPLVGFLAFRLGTMASACVAMGWMVLHPWVMEFATSARGYSFAMLFLLVAVVAAVRVFRDAGGWRWWVLYGLGQILAFTSLPTVAHMLVLLNLAVFVGLLFDRTVNAGARLSHIRAFFATNLVALGFALGYFLPKLEPLDEYIDSGVFASPMHWSWMGDCLSDFLTGQPYQIWEEANPFAVSTGQWPPAVFALCVLVAIAILGSALVTSYRRGVFAFALGLAILLPPLTVYIQGRLSSFYMLPWYAVWQLPLWIALLSAGATSLVDYLPGQVSFRRRAMAVVAMLAFAFTVTHQRRSALLTVPFESLRESAALVRDSLNPFAPGHEEVITTSLVSANHAYDAWNHRLRSAEDFWEQVAQAEQRGVPLFCTTAWIELVEINHPDVYALLRNPEYFEQVGPPLYGLHVHHTRHTFRYKPGALAAQLEERENTGG